MKPSNLKTVVDFYNNVICQQIIKPIECEEVYRLVNPNGPAVPYYQKMRAISVYVQGLQQEVLNDLEQLFEEFDEEQVELKSTQDPRSKDYIPEDSAASPSVPDDQQSHSEEPLTKNGETDTEEVVDAKVDSKVPEDEIKDIPQHIIDKAMMVRLEQDYEDAETANEKRSLKMKINALKKKLDDE